MALKPNTSNKVKEFSQGWKQGLKDVNDSLAEGNYKLIAKQVVVVIVAFLILRFGVGKLNEQTKAVRTQIDAIRVQQSSEQDYLTSKRKLLSLEPRFPEVKEKDQWLISKLLEVFQPANVTANMNELQVENGANPNYLIISKKVSFSTKFLDFGKLLAEIENRPEYMRISEFSLRKNPDPNDLEMNTVDMTFNTVFPKEKLAPVLFKDYKGVQK